MLECGSLELGFEKAGEEGRVFYITSQTKNRLGVVKDPYEMTVGGRVVPPALRVGPHRVFQ